MFNLDGTFPGWLKKFAANYPYLIMFSYYSTCMYTCTYNDYYFIDTSINW